MEEKFRSQQLGFVRSSLGCDLSFGCPPSSPWAGVVLEHEPSSESTAFSVKQPRPPQSARLREAELRELILRLGTSLPKMSASGAVGDARSRLGVVSSLALPMSPLDRCGSTRHHCPSLKTSPSGLLCPRHLLSRCLNPTGAPRSLKKATPP